MKDDEVGAGGLPRSWADVALGDLTVRSQNGFSRRHGDNGFPTAVLRLADIKENRISRSNLRYIGMSENERAQYLLTDADLLFIRVNGSRDLVGQPIWARGNSDLAYCDHFIRYSLEPTGVLPSYLSCFFVSPDARRQVENIIVSTAGQHTISQARLEHLRVPLAPLPEQARIVAEIEHKFSLIDAGIARLNRARANLRRYRASVLQAACTGRLVPTEAELARAEARNYEPADLLLQRILSERRTRWESEQLAKMKAQGKEPKDDHWKAKYKEPVAPDTSILSELPCGWVWATVEQSAANEPAPITDGPFGSNLKTEHYVAEGPRVIRLQNIGDGKFVDAKSHITQDRFEALKRHNVATGDIVIAGLSERPPRSCVIPDSVGPSIVKADCIRLRPHPSLSTMYLHFALNAEPTRKRTSEAVHGVGRPRLNLGEIKAIALPLPPAAEQERIVAEVERRLSVADHMEATLTANLKRAERLKQSILRDAFAGRLVPQNHTDEPASVLLERIRAEREAAKSVAPQKPLRQKKSAGQPELALAGLETDV